MRGYLAYFKMRLLTALQYRTAALAGISTQFFFGLVYLMIYTAFYSNSSATPPMSFPQIISYLWLQQAFLAMFMIFYRDNDIAEMIRSGGVAYELCRPYNLYNLWMTKLIANRLAATSLRCLPILLVAFWLPAPYALGMPDSPMALLMFIITLFLGSLVVIAASLLVHILTLITLEQTALTNLLHNFWEILSGNYLPVPLMPAWLQSIVFWLPCRLGSDLPFRIYSGHIDYSEAQFSLGLQVFWLVVLVATGQMLFAYASKRITVQGG